MINGLDTETLDGYAKLLAIENEGCFIVDNLDAILILLRMHGREYIAFNLDYDALAILKYLPFELARKLSLGYSIVYKNYSIKYIPRKKLIISYGHRSIIIYDCYQFFLMSLNNAAKKYLGKTKTEGISGADINEENIYSELARKYCYEDACLCGELWRYFENNLPDELHGVKPLSCATVSYKYFRTALQECEIPHEINAAFRSAFRGGRFEVFQRGYFENVSYYDINSAYPAALANAQTLLGAEFIEEPVYHPNENYGVYCISTEIPDKHLSPVMLERKHRIFCPVGNVKKLWVTHFEMAHLPYNTEVHYALHVYCKSAHRPFSEKISYLYPRKKENVSFKTILNSLFGKTAQTIEKYKIAKGYVDGENLQIEGSDIYEWYLDSRISNFVLASYITAYCRDMLYKTIIPVQDNTIACFTDCVIATSPIPNIDKGTSLGQWKGETWSKLWMIGSGVYFWEKEGKIDGRFRGFDIKNSEEILNKILSSDSTIIDIPVTQRVSLIESINQSYYECANMIYDGMKQLNINFDQKRVWMDDFTSGKDIGEKQIKSLAIPLLF